MHKDTKQGVWMINIRKLDNGHIFVQYQQDGAALDAGFESWAKFIKWLKEKVTQ